MWNTLLNILLVFFCTIFAFLIFIILYYKHSFQHWNKLGIPHPTPTFPFGNIEPNFSKYIGQSIAQIYHTMKNSGHAYCGYFLFAMPVFMPISPKLNKHFLTIDFNSFNHRGFHSDEINDPMGASLVTWSGEKWKKNREKLTPAFSAKKTKMMMPLVMNCTKELESTLDNEIQIGHLINLEDLIKRYSIDVICSCAFGIEGNCLKNPNSEFIHYTKMIVTTDLLNNLRLGMGVSAPYLMKLFKINLFDPKVTNFFRNVVAESVIYREKNNIQRDDFLDIMIRLRNNKSIEDDNESNNNIESDEKVMTIDAVASQSFVFFLAGYETTSSSIMYTIYELAKNQHIQNKLREEINKVLKDFSNELTYESIKSIRYLDNVLNETLRKYPVVLMLNRACTEDFRIPDTNIIIKKGTKAVLSTLGIHSDPEFYPNPEKFDPDRFTDEAKAKRPSYVYLPFGDGPRICPGMRFGTLEAKLCIANLIMKFNFSTLDDIKLCTVGNVLVPESPIYFRLKRI